MSDEAPQTPEQPSPETVGRSIMSGFQVVAAALEHLGSRFPSPSPFLAGLIEQLRSHAGTVAASLPQPEPAPEPPPVMEAEPETAPSPAPDTTVTSGGWSDPNATSATQP